MNIINYFNEEQKYVIDLVKKACILKNTKLYIVGGAVRDAILKKEIKDIDICIDENPKIIIQELRYIKEYKYYEKFETSTIKFENNVTIDLIRCRQEKYSLNGSLPIVRPSNLYEDIYRRDFTINSLAYDVICDKIIDYFGGMKDISLKRIRKIHKFSYIEDPTRIFRAIRYGIRCNFYIYDLKEIKEAILNGAIHTISNDRIMKEIYLICSEDNWIENIKLCKKLGIFSTNIDLLGKERDLFDYNCIYNRILNLFVALEDDKYIKIFINNSVLEKKYIKTLKNYVTLKKKIKNSFFKTVSNYEIYKVLNNFYEDEIKLLGLTHEFKYKIINYLKNINSLEFNINGNDICSIGTFKGEEIGRIINFLRKITVGVLLPLEKEYLNRNLREVKKWH